MGMSRSVPGGEMMVSGVMAPLGVQPSASSDSSSSDDDDEEYGQMRTSFKVRLR